MQVDLRSMREQDWEDVRTIFLEGIRTGDATFETDAPSWLDWDRGHLMAPRIIAFAGDGVLGWAALSPVSGRCTYAGVAEVSVYVTESARGQGVGKALLGRLIRDSESAGIWTLQAGIFPENLASVSLHKSLGFRLVGKREKLGQLRGQWRDVLLMERRSLAIGI